MDIGPQVDDFDARSWENAVFRVTGLRVHQVRSRPAAGPSDEQRALVGQAAEQTDGVNFQRRQEQYLKAVKKHSRRCEMLGHEVAQNRFYGKGVASSWNFQ